MSIDVMNMMKQFLMVMAALLALPLCAASAGREVRGNWHSVLSCMPRSGQKRAFLPGLCCLRGSMVAASSARTMHMYLAVQTDAGKPRLVLTHDIAAA